MRHLAIAGAVVAALGVASCGSGEGHWTYTEHSDPITSAVTAEASIVDRSAVNKDIAGKLQETCTRPPNSANSEGALHI